jgi:hypothetical protein
MAFPSTEIRIWHETANADANQYDQTVLPDGAIAQEWNPPRVTAPLSCCRGRHSDLYRNQVIFSPAMENATQTAMPQKS